MSKIGILIPTRAERLETLAKALESVHMQTCQVELIIICPQEKIPVIERIARSIVGDEVFFAMDPGIGLSAALNIGFDSLSDDVNFVCWLGDDDFLSANFSETMLAGLESDPQAPFAAGFCQYVDGDGQPFRIQKPKWMSRTGLTVFPVQIAQPATLIRRKAITGNLVDPNLKYAMDLDLWLRLVSKGKPVIVSEITATYRWHSASLSSANVRSALVESSQVRAKYGRQVFRPLQVALDWSAMAQLRLFGPRFDRDSARQKIDKG